MKEKIEECPECKNYHLKYDKNRGEWCCLECGLVVENKTLDQAGGVNQSKDPKYRIGIMAYRGGLGSYIDWKNLDSKGNKISSQTRSTINRMRKWHNGFRGSEKRRIMIAMSRLHSLLQQLNTKKQVKIEAETILLKSLKKIDVRGRSFEPLVAAVTYVAYKVKKVPKSLDEISKVASISKKRINRCRGLLLNALEIKTAPLDFSKYIPEISEKLDISRESQILASQLLKKAEKNGLDLGRKPIGLVAAALYLACQQNEKLTQNELASATNVTPPTLRARYKELKNLQ